MANKTGITCKIVDLRRDEKLHEFKVLISHASGLKEEVWVPGFVLPHTLIHEKLHEKKDTAVEPVAEVEENLAVKGLRAVANNVPLQEVEVIWELSDKCNTAKSTLQTNKAEVDRELEQLCSQSSKEQIREQLLQIINERENNNIPKKCSLIGDEERCKIEAHINLRSNKDRKTIALSKYIRKDERTKKVLNYLKEHYTDTVIIPPDLKDKVRKLERKYKASCECIGECRPDKCKHDIVYNDRGCIMDQYIEASCVIYECNSGCKCSLSCPNRVVQRGSLVQKEVFSTGNIHVGLGVRTNQFVKKGTFIGVYGGLLSTVKEEENLYVFQIGHYEDIEKNKFLIDASKHGNEDIEKNKFFIDASKHGNATKLFNHSCSPNVSCYPVHIECSDRSLHDVAFFAACDIQKGEELCIDYGKKYFKGYPGMRCLCLNHDVTKQ